MFVRALPSIKTGDTVASIGIAAKPNAGLAAR
jgi:hypothetical protein